MCVHEMLCIDEILTCTHFALLHCCVVSCVMYRGLRQAAAAANVTVLEHLFISRTCAMIDVMI